MDQTRYLRQQQIIPAARLAAVKATVIGVGAIGRQVALQLAAIGVPWLQLIDHDTVEELNLPVQGYLESDVGRPKVEATAEMCQRLNSQIELHIEQARFRRSMEIGNAVFCCVDKINTRRLIWDAVKDKADFWVDGRMSAEVLRVLTACDAASRKHYPTTLFAQEEAFVGACTARSTIFCANIAAGMMLAGFTRWLRGFPVDPDISLNLLSNELAIRPFAAVQGPGHGQEVINGLAAEVWRAGHIDQAGVVRGDRLPLWRAGQFLKRHEVGPNGTAIIELFRHSVPVDENPARFADIYPATVAFRQNR